MVRSIGWILSVGLAVPVLSNIGLLFADDPAPPSAALPEAPSDTLIGESTYFAGEGCPQPCPVCDAPRSACCCGHSVDWSKVPGSIRPMPRLGHFPIPPTGCGYYSLCDQLAGTRREQAPASGYPAFFAMPPSFFDADFRYLESNRTGERTFVEELKRIPLGDCLTFSTGGQFAARYMHERNSRLTETDNTYTLGRVRAYGDLMYGDKFRVFAEYIWADSFSEELSPLPIDVNRGDLLNLFMDVNLFDYEGRPVYARIGRQELLLGSQRLVSTLDWANVRRTFEGVRLFRTGEKWDVDLFYTAFVPPDPSSFDHADENVEFGGAWATYRPQPGHFADFYYLYLDNSNTVTQQGIARSPTELHTFGTRYLGDRDGFLWEYEVALQFGNQNGQDVLAGAATVGAGRNFKESRWSPTVWLYYDYASGDSDPAAGDAHTFNPQFPFGHYYLGWIDQVGRQNIHDLNAHLYFYPQPWLTVWLQYHHFWLDESQDALYNAAGNAIRRDPTGAAGRNVGDEIDVVVNVHVGRYSDVLVGYSRLFGGGFLESTSGATAASDAELFYMMYQQRW